MSLILAISGPAAVGKTTICERLTSEFGYELNRLVTATTRSPRLDEKHGVDYFFLSRSEFDEKLSAGCFLEHEVIHGNKYGILKKTVLDAQGAGSNILLNIDVNGAASLRKFCQTEKQLNGCLKTIFIKPSSLDELVVRIHTRASESDEQKRVRLANAEAEILRAGEFDFVLESSDRNSDYLKVKEIYLDLK